MLQSSRAPLADVSVSSLSAAYKPEWDGNHVDAKSETWTWGGHLAVLEPNADGQLARSERGFGLIHYYARNAAPMGSLTFRTSAMTPTVQGEGRGFEAKTLYSSDAKDFALSVRSGVLDLRLAADGRSDHIRETPFTPADGTALRELLALYPGLKVAPGFTPKKTELRWAVGKGDELTMTLYSIWPAIAPNGDGTMAFLGIHDTQTFTEPMVVGRGTLRRGDETLPVSAMMFIDRQWSKRYFGEKMLGAGLMPSPHKALARSHEWSAFHGFDPQQQTWSFFHAWQQYGRAQDRADVRADYNGMMFVDHDGRRSAMMPATGYTHENLRFSPAKKDHNVFLNYANGLPSFFPSAIRIASPTLEASLVASPRRQMAPQPIYLFEGYARGAGNWQGRPIELTGRIESSRLMFRDSDYREMLASPGEGSWRQVVALAEQKNARMSWFERLRGKAGYVVHDLARKLKLGWQALTRRNSYASPTDPAVTIYR